MGQAKSVFNNSASSNSENGCKIQDVAPGTCPGFSSLC